MKLTFFKTPTLGLGITWHRATGSNMEGSYNFVILQIHLIAWVLHLRSKDFNNQPHKEMFVAEWLDDEDPTSNCGPSCHCDNQCGRDY